MDDFAKDRLTDDEIQAYLDGDPSVNRAEVERKLRSSGEARYRMAVYRRLYSGLEDDTGFMLSADFSDAVLTRLKGGHGSKFSLLETGMLVIAVVLGIGSTLYFTSLRGFFITLFENQVTGLTSLVQSMPILSKGGLHLFLYGLIILLVIGFLDKMFLQFRKS